MLALRRVLLLELLRDFRVRCRLAAAVIAHQDDVLEAGGDALLGDALQDAAENLRRQADRARQIGARVVRRVGQDRHEDRVTQLQRDRLDDFVRHQRVAAVDVLRSALLGTAVVDEGGRFPLFEGLLDLEPGHHFKIDQGRLGLGVGGGE